MIYKNADFSLVYSTCILISTLTHFKTTHRHIRLHTYIRSFMGRIRVPLTPEILKSSNSWTTISLFGSSGSVFLTWTHNRNSTVHHNKSAHLIWKVIVDRPVVKVSVIHWQYSQISAALSHPGLSLYSALHSLPLSLPQIASLWIDRKKTQTRE